MQLDGPAPGTLTWKPHLGPTFSTTALLPLPRRPTSRALTEENSGLPNRQEEVPKRSQRVCGWLDGQTDRWGGGAWAFPPQPVSIPLPSTNDSPLFFQGPPPSSVHIVWLVDPTPQRQSAPFPASHSDWLGDKQGPKVGRSEGISGPYSHRQ